MWSVKRLTVFFVLAVALCGSGTAIADAPYVTVQNANVREQADVNSMRVITFPKGTRVDVTFKEGDWYAVSRDGIHFGYIWSELLAPEDQGSNVTEAPVEEIKEHAPTFDETDLKKFKALNECKECELSGANLKGANLKRADLRSTNLSGANLSGANLGKARLHGANLSKANLSGADLWGANLSGVDLSTATLRNAKLDGAILCKTKMPWGEENSGCKKVKKTSKEPVCINRCVDTVGACAKGKDMKPETCGAELTLCLKGC